MNDITNTKEWQAEIKAKRIPMRRVGRILWEEKAESRAVAMNKCMTTVMSKDCFAGHYSKTVSAVTCKDRLCPYCNSRRSHKLSRENHDILKELFERYKPRFIFLTLTVKNCDGENLDDTIKAISKAYKYLIEYDEVKKYLLGTIRTIEIVPSQDKDEYHPHIHALIAVSGGYFSRGYIDQKRWRELWARAAKLDYDPRVDVRIVKPKKGHEASDTLGAAQEVSSYSVKSSEYADENVPEETARRIIATLMYALKNHRLISFSGELKKIRAELKQSDADDFDEVCTLENCPVCGSGLVEVLHKFK